MTGVVSVRIEYEIYNTSGKSLYLIIHVSPSSSKGNALPIKCQKLLCEKVVDLCRTRWAACKDALSILSSYLIPWWQSAQSKDGTCFIFCYCFAVKYHCLIHLYYDFHCHKQDHGILYKVSSQLTKEGTIHNSCRIFHDLACDSEGHNRGELVSHTIT